MIVYICINCGEIFDYGDAIKRSENVGDFWGSPAYMSYDACPYCSSGELQDYEEEDEEDD